MSRKESKGQLMRLQTALMLFVKQQCQRASEGGPEEWDDIADENLQFVEKVLPVIEEALDEVHLEQLEELRIPAFPAAFMPTMFRIPGFPKIAFPFFEPNPRATKGDGAINEIVSDFQEDLQVEVRKARRHDRGLTDEELAKLLERLREELSSVAKRTPRSRKVKAGEEA
jgi:hypothetical protein